MPLSRFLNAVLCFLVIRAEQIATVQMEAVDYQGAINLLKKPALFLINDKEVNGIYM